MVALATSPSSGARAMWPPSKLEAKPSRSASGMGSPGMPVSARGEPEGLPKEGEIGMLEPQVTAGGLLGEAVCGLAPCFTQEGPAPARVVEQLGADCGDTPRQLAPRTIT